MGRIRYDSIQMNDPLETAELLAFAKTVDAKSLSRAAIELGIPRATIGRRLARLEERLGVRLLRRTTRSLTLTDAGNAFYRQARLVLDAVDQAEASVSRSDAVRGPLRISMPPLGLSPLQSMLVEFAQRHPDVKLSVHASSEYVDLQRGGFDVALRASAQLEPGLIARTLARSELIAVASKAYLAEHGTPKSVRDLRRHRLLLGYARGELPQTHWPLRSGGKVHVEGPFASNDITLLREAAVAGLGIAVLPMQAVEEALDDGRLTAVLRGTLGTDSRLSVVYPEREFVPPQVRAFVDAIVAWAPGRLLAGSSALRDSDQERAGRNRKKHLSNRSPRAKTGRP